ncbi:unnamed protein product [Echinostoma caproni]|uniref:Transmembrane protein n=1 Tax=Echinostoma caproni TaxID=27848 RepID=A0A183BB80_9TREM|nr:unnamed protein product [Echinostoma caproni]
MTHPWVAVDSKSFLPMTLTVMDQQGPDAPRSVLSDAMSVFTPSASYLSSQNPSTIHVSIHLPGALTYCMPVLIFVILYLFSASRFILTQRNHMQEHRSSCLNFNPEKCLECIFTLNRPFPISIRQRTVSEIRRLRHVCSYFSVIGAFLQQCALFILHYCSPVIFPGLLKADFKQLRRDLSMTSRASHVPLSFLIDKICDAHFDAYLKFAHNILSNCTHPLHIDLCACKSHPFQIQSHPISSIGLQKFFDNLSFPDLLIQIASMYFTS